MSLETILIPLASDSRDLKALHHAISLAERIDSRIIVFAMEPDDRPGKAKNPVIETCMDLVNRVHENGLNISLFIASDDGEEGHAEFMQLLARESIDLIIVSDTESYVKEMIKKNMPRIFCQVVQVKEKNGAGPLHG